MNKSVTSPHPPKVSGRPVDKGGNRSTGCSFFNTASTRPFPESSPIHNPYYSYSFLFKYRAVRREGKSCAYPS